jgi:hypothetical protein
MKEKGNPFLQPPAPVVKVLIPGIYTISAKENYIHQFAS